MINAKNNKLNIQIYYEKSSSTCEIRNYQKRQILEKIFANICKYF